MSSIPNPLSTSVHLEQFPLGKGEAREASYSVSSVDAYLQHSPDTIVLSEGHPIHQEMHTRAAPSIYVWIEHLHAPLQKFEIFCLSDLTTFRLQFVRVLLDGLNSVQNWTTD